MWLIPAHAGKTGAYWPSETRPWAHPRSRGENEAAKCGGGLVQGSSPLTRGKLWQGISTVVSGGLSPAHAGKTPGRRRRCPGTWAHPRSRGENFGRAVRFSWCRGSSPLTRGKLRHDRDRGRGYRLIPAHAGKTSTSHGSAPRKRAHPRSRGENSDTYCGRGPGMGSSPLTRGKRQLVDQCQEESGLIPAHAGKTLYVNIEGYVWRAHPRSRGENTHGGSQFSTITGSSPLTRGKHEHARELGVLVGLIPAHAGKTTRPVTPASPSWAHPRSRGENSGGRMSPRTGKGSSPLTRGKPRPQGRQARRQGLIPAHAGKTRASSRRRTGIRAHPRSRGENSDGSGATIYGAGSSPLTRGKHLADRVHEFTHGLIPAHAGKTSRRP